MQDKRQFSYREKTFSLVDHCIPLHNRSETSRFEKDENDREHEI